VVRVAVLALVVACRPAVDTTDAPTIFAASCAPCHGPRGAPDAALIARIGVRDLTAADLRARMTPELVEQQVRNGSANRMMPAFDGVLRPDQIKSVAAWVASPAFVATP
jgi:mono/diheme cytochrome c family protein